MLAGICACDKGSLGVYQPKMKIFQIYNEADGHYLQEQWVWQGDLLSKIDYYRKNGNIDYTQTYVYDGKRISRIESGDQYSEFLYDGKALTTINTYDGDNLLETYRFSYDKKQLSHINITVYENNKFKNYLFNSFVPVNEEVVREYIASSDSKREKYDFSAADIDLVWADDNIANMKMQIVRPDSIQHLTFSYIYDDNINPRNGFFALFFDHQLLNDQPQYAFSSKNNATNVLVTNEYGVHSNTIAHTYSYDYYKKFPTKVYSTFINVETSRPDSSLLYSYHYQ